MSPSSSRLIDTPGVSAALAFVTHVYGRRVRRPGRTMEHPVDVAVLLAAHGQPPSVVVAGLLHDVLEDTDVSSNELLDRFGWDVTRLVQAATEDGDIDDYRDRKAALRKEILDAGPQAATIALADKLAKLEVARQRPRKRRLAHYRATLDGVEERYGRSPLSERLREQLARW